MARRVLTLLLLSMAFSSAAVESCIQLPQRVKACPNMLYRVAKLPGMPKAEVVCICASDFSPLLRVPANDAEQIQQNMTRRQFEVLFGEKLPAVLAILQRKA